jgi:hypothetical protein
MVVTPDIPNTTRQHRQHPMPVALEYLTSVCPFPHSPLKGMCNTDIEIMKGYMGYNGILGHEYVAPPSPSQP